MRKWKVVITGRTLRSALELIERQAEILMWDEKSPIPRDLLLDWVKDADGLLCTGNVKVDDELLAHAPHLRVISQASVGYDNVDINACTKRGIPFSNTPGVLVETTADLTYGLLLTASRRIHEGWDQVRRGDWKNAYDIPFGVDLYGKTLGIVGLGQIGVAVARRAQASGMKVIYHNRSRRSDEQALGVTYSGFNELLASSDYVVVLVPLSSESKGLFGAEQFARMKPTALFVNAARGGIVQTEALVQALQNGQIAYAALDVTDPEPLPGDHPLLSLPNVLITPHVGSATFETRNRMAVLCAENLLAGLDKKPLPTCVNTEVNYKGQ